MWRILLTLSVLLATGCAAKVGDDCKSNTDCGIELVCDLSQPGGYCTQTPCELNECPLESACIRFEDDTRYCMLRCESNGDCRSGYVCVDNFGDVPFCNPIEWTP